jgi:hypothetical protein
MRRLTLFLASLALVFALPAVAQAPQIHIRGKIAGLAGDTLAVATREGPVAKIKLAPDWAVVIMKLVDVAAIQPGSFIGTTNIDRPEGGGKSLEVHVFPPGVKIGEGHYPWDLKPGSMMTNGTVGKVVTSANGRELEVAYAGGVRHIVVPAGVPVVTTFPGSRADIKPGIGVVIFAVKAPSGDLTTNRVLIGENGIAPPM